MRKYEEAMEHISVTPEMRARVLERIRQTDLTAGRPAPVIRRSGRLPGGGAGGGADPS